MKKHSPSLKSSLLDSLNNDYSQLSQNYSTQIIRGYLKKDLNSIYSFIDKDASIKLVFNQQFLKEYLSSLPTYITYENLENYMITLKKYRFDYLIYQNGKEICYKIVCYVDIFDIDTSSKKLIDPLPDNVNMNKETKAKSQEVFSKIIRDIVNNELNNNYDNSQLSAKNFIFKNYKENNKKPVSVYEIIKNICKVKESLFLLKSCLDIDNMGYLYDDNDSKTNFILKSLDWKNLFASMPSMSNKKGEVFASNTSPLNTLIEKISYRNLTPAPLDMNIVVNDQTIQKFLEKKVKRQREDEFNNKKIPSKIKDLMKKYGDVLANIGKSGIEQYKKHNIYSEINN